MNKRHYEHTLPNIRGSLSNTYDTYLKNMRLDNDRKADFRTENPRSAFSFLAVKIAVCQADCARRPLSGAGLAERKSSSLRCGIFFRQTLRVRPRDCQAGEK